jgi:hypothetical protein
VHITDRAKGQHAFEDYIEKYGELNECPKSAYCAGHILMNARKNAPKEQKGFHAGLFWAIQGSRTIDDMAEHLEVLGSTCPDVADYLLDIPAHQWVWFAQGICFLYDFILICLIYLNTHWHFYACHI